MTTKSPYAGGPIFDAVDTLKDIIIRIEAKRNDPNDKMAKLYAGPEVYERMYKAAEKRLSQGDMLTVAEASKRLSITVKEYEALAAKGEALLINLGGKKFVPEWQFGADGKIDDLKLDIAREFVLEGRSSFKFMDFIEFMTAKTANISSLLPKKKLGDIIKKAGLEEFKCSLSVEATMNQLADQRHANPAFRDKLFKELDEAVTHGGWDPSGGLSRPFRDKYKIPGMTIDEDRMASIQKQNSKKPPKP